MSTEGSGWYSRLDSLALNRSASPRCTLRSLTTASSRSRFASLHPPLSAGISASPSAYTSMSRSKARGRFGG